jgi:hypothetical protein
MLLVEQRYRGLRSQPTVDRAAVYRWMAWHHLRGNRRRKAMYAYARAVGCGDVRSLGRALVGMIWPGVVSRVKSSEGVGERTATVWLSELKPHEQTEAAPI